MKIKNQSITDVPGIKIGHAQDYEALTGCSVVICPPGTIGGIDQRGGAPGTRETDLLRPMHLLNEVHAIFLTGGSAYGLDVAAGIMKFLEEQKIGINTVAARVPIVAGAVLYDLDIGNLQIRPDQQMGYQACLSATSNSSAQGNIGAGTGARVGNIFGVSRAMKSGIGTASIETQSGPFVGAIVAVNAFGDVLDLNTREIIAGTCTENQLGIDKGKKGVLCKHTGDDALHGWLTDPEIKFQPEYCDRYGSHECQM